MRHGAVKWVCVLLILLLLFQVDEKDRRIETSQRNVKILERKLKNFERLRELHSEVNVEKWEDFCRLADDMKNVSKALANATVGETSERSSL